MKRRYIFILIGDMKYKNDNSQIFINFFASSVLVIGEALFFNKRCHAGFSTSYHWKSNWPHSVKQAVQKISYKVRIKLRAHVANVHHLVTAVLQHKVMTVYQTSEGRNKRYDLYKLQRKKKQHGFKDRTERPYSTALQVLSSRDGYGDILQQD